MTFDPPLTDPDGNPIYLTEYERLMDELLSTGTTTLQTPNVTFTLTLDKAAP